MILRHKKLLFITSLITLSPMAFGLYAWDKLPEQMATHFSHNVPNGWSSKPFAVFAIPLILFLLHWVCVLGTLADPKRKNISDKIFALVVWIVPVSSLVCGYFIYGYALGKNFQSEFFQNCLLGLLFLILGNYFPKCRQNYTIGIKLPWTLANEENWNRTHRFGAKTYVAAGIITIICAIFHIPYLTAAAILAAVVLPVFYSLYLHIKQGL